MLISLFTALHLQYPRISWAKKQLTNMKDAESYKYKWVVLLSASFVCSLTWGLAYTIGVFYVSWVDQFDAGKGELAVIGGINTGVASLLGTKLFIFQRYLDGRGNYQGPFLLTWWSLWLHPNLDVPCVVITFHRNNVNSLCIVLKEYCITV